MIARFVFLKLLLPTALVVSDLFDSDIEKKINDTLKRKKVSDSGLLVEVETFVRHDGKKIKGQAPSLTNSSGPPAAAAGTKESLRVYPEYSGPNERQLRNKVMDLIRQLIYGTQERMALLLPILKKYENDHVFRMAFIFNRLRQLVTDIKRTYSLAKKTKNWQKVVVYTEIYWYAHIVKMYFDILYIVEYVIDYHKAVIKEFSLF